MNDVVRGLVPLGENPLAPGRPIPQTREITVNGRSHLIEGDSVDHQQLVRLAYPDIRPAESAALTVTYRGGPLQAAEGLLTSHQRTPIAQGEAFVVSRTVAS